MYQRVRLGTVMVKEIAYNSKADASVNHGGNL